MLDQVEREFLESSMEDLNVSRISSSVDEDELRINKNVKIVRERSKGYLQDFAIGV